jgi:phenylalanyl-tRNA synthetase beta chain
MALPGAWPPAGVARVGAPLDFLDVKGIVENLLLGLGTASDRVRVAATKDVAFLHPGKVTSVALDRRTLGVLGALHPRLVQMLDLASEVSIAELDFEQVAQYVPRPFLLKLPPRFPAVTETSRWLSPRRFKAMRSAKQFLRSAIRASRARGCSTAIGKAPIAPRRKSLAYSIAYRAAKRTLTDDEVPMLHGRLREHLRERFALELRS